jgi:hypothetical protein
MKAVSCTLSFAIAATCFGCPGTIDDPSLFEGYGQSVTNTPTSPDAGAVQADAAQTGQTGNGSSDAGTDAGSSLHDAGAAHDSGADAARDSATVASSDGSVSCDFKALIQAKCGSAGCHGGPTTSTGLDLTSDNLADRVSGRHGADSCAEQLMIDKANPAQSVLYLRVTGTTCGVRMPIGGSLSESDQACVLEWLGKP